MLPMQPRRNFGRLLNSFIDCYVPVMKDWLFANGPSMRIRTLEALSAR
jgi:hypothetical protein